MDEQCETSFVAQEGRRIDFWLACMVMYREPWCSLATYQGGSCCCVCVCEPHPVLGAVSCGGDLLVHVQSGRSYKYKIANTVSVTNTRD